MIKINKAAINQARQQLAIDLVPVVANGTEVAKGLAPVDTSSLQESIRTEIRVEGNKIVIDLVAGGVDYSGQVMASTGEIGNVVDYAADQEAIHGFLSLGAATTLEQIRGIRSTPSRRFQRTV